MATDEEGVRKTKGRGRKEERREQNDREKEGKEVAFGPGG